MASLSRDAEGCWIIQFLDAEKHRKTIRLPDSLAPRRGEPKSARRQAQLVKLRFDALEDALAAKRSPDARLQEWLDDQDPVFYERLLRAGLLPRPPSIEAFISAYIASREDAKLITWRTGDNSRQALNWFLQFLASDASGPELGSQALLSQIDTNVADKWALWLRTKKSKGGAGLAENTARRHAGRFREFFKGAIRQRLYRGSNPFEDLDVTVGETEKMFHVDLTLAAHVLSILPDAEWRLLFALSRFGGLRCPSEALALRWADVDWARGRLTVRSSKTKRHDGKQFRIIPIFPEMRRYVDEAFELAEPGAVHLLERHREHSNLAARFIDYLLAAGIAPWPQPFHNLRRTRENELAEKFGGEVACKWIGNNPKVALKHYLRPQEGHYQKALADKSGAQALDKALQMALQTPSCTELQDDADSGMPRKMRYVQPLAAQSTANYPRQDSNLRPTV